MFTAVDFSDSSIKIGYHFKALKYCLGLLQVCKKMYSGSNDLRSHLKKCHPNIGNNIKPNLPLTPQILVNISVSNESENIASVLWNELGYFTIL